MLTFGFLWPHGRLVVYDVALENHSGHQIYVATISAFPDRRFSGRTPENAVAQLQHHVFHSAAASLPPVA